MSFSRGCPAFLIALGLILATGALAPAQVDLQPRMGEPLNGLTPDQLALFEAGKTLYNTPLEVADGLGPVFNKESCGNCHNQPAVGGPGTQTVTRFGHFDKGLPFDPLAEFGGSLLQASTIDVDCQEILPPEANITAERTTTSSFGVGLIEAIPGADIEALQANGGMAHMVPGLEDPPGSPLRVGRFGWKAQLATVLSFSADASQQELGLSNRLVPFDNDPNGINPPTLAECDTIPDPEDGPPDAEGFEFIDRVTHFQRFLAQPPQTPRSGMSGEVIFGDIGCASCHHPEFTTADDPALEDFIRNQTIKPYSDFLLHDMGVLGDGIVQGDATELLMRTPPLWGLRTRTQILHDGRAGLLPGEDIFANRIDRAIQEHGGDAFPSKDAYNGLLEDEKLALIVFLDSLGRAEFDFDGDNEIDEEDFQIFLQCFTGSGSFYTPDDSCSIGDVDQDGDVDLDDADLFLQAYEGTNGAGDCNNNGTVDLMDIVIGASGDCNGNSLPDECDIAGGTSDDDDGNGIPDECEHGFTRGDCDGDGEIGLTDAVFELNYLFVNGPTPPCRDACDLNDDGSLDLADPVYNLSFQFVSGPDPAQPYPLCGDDPTPGDALDCLDFAGCP